MTKEELAGQRIAKKVIREMLSSVDHRRDIKDVAERHVTSYMQALYVGKHVNVYCRQLAAALRKMK